MNKLARETPALIIAFDLLLDGEGKPLIDLPLSERRRKLDLLAPKYFRGTKRIRLSPATSKLVEAKRWLDRVGATLDGIIAKRRDSRRVGSPVSTSITFRR